ncbi:MAG: hypothetical protein FWE07_07620 [Turicibacter sp.]|nr:hypothetical protein [Turicibacter sp.]
MIKNKMGLILIPLIFLGILILSYLNYTVSQERQMFIANRLYSTWSVELVEELELDQLTETLPRNSRVFLEHTAYGHVRTFYQNGNWVPPMMSGYFFNSDTSMYSAVVGKSHVANGETAIEINDTTYEIIGVVGSGYPSALDRLILLNTLPENVDVLNVIIDARRSSDMEEISNLFNIRERHSTYTALDFLNNHTLDEMIRTNIVLVMVISSFLLGYIYLMITERRRITLYLIGMSDFIILLKNSFELISLTLISFVVVIFIDVLVGYGITLMYWYFYGVLLILIIMMYIANYLFKCLAKLGGVLFDK